MNPDLSIWSLFTQASLLVQLVMLCLLMASVLSWTIIIQRAFILRRAKKSMEKFEEKFWSGTDLRTLYDALGVRRYEIKGLEKIFYTGFREYTRLVGQLNITASAVMDGVQRSMGVALSRECSYLEKNISFLATVGSVSPYVGLFGTVWGIMHSFLALGSAQQATIAMVAPGIAEALIATAIGLFAAIPAVIAYNRFAHVVEKLSFGYENFSEELATILYRQTFVVTPAEMPGESHADEAKTIQTA